MQIPFLGKLSLFLVILSFPLVLPPSSKSLLCPLLAWGAQVRNFGYDGRDGDSITYNLLFTFASGLVEAIFLDMPHCRLC